MHACVSVCLQMHWCRYVFRCVFMLVHKHVETSGWCQMSSLIAFHLEHIEATYLIDPRVYCSASLAGWFTLRIPCLCIHRLGLKVATIRGSWGFELWSSGLLSKSFTPWAIFPVPCGLFLCKWLIVTSLEFIRDVNFYNNVSKSKWGWVWCYQGSEIAKRLSSSQLLSIGSLLTSICWEWYPIYGKEWCDWLVMSASGIEVEIHVWYISRGSKMLLTVDIRRPLKNCPCLRYILWAVWGVKMWSQII